MSRTAQMLNDNNHIYQFESSELPKVSVIVSTYKRDNSLRKALSSLINQHYNNVEVIIIDDNANEKWNLKVESIVNKVKEQFNGKLAYVQNKKNYGSARSRNIGIKIASGEYITFLDDDDIYLPNKIQKQVEHMIKQKSDFSITDLYLYDEGENLVQTRIRSYLKKYTKNDLLRYHLLYHMTGTDTLMFKKSFLEEIGGFPQIDIGDEFYLMLRAINAEGKLSYLSTCDVKAYVHPKSEGLSSSEGKIKGEKYLFEYKKQFFSILSKKDINYIKMRHYAVLSFTEYRNKNLINFIKYFLYSFFSSPYGLLDLYIKRKSN
ncbi:glycosyltransferase family 2 protein [Bacillus suaedaesalsae]|uniref:Glycosyltransferase family 2 protein n=1 Tax=Bacillus suaedaesalsae TaxID=2810349 RepID=A0ABS2DKS5_9BACI|nr:glycosyltransferase family 2 protein [Bacillus suaedaesalsae]MBM6619101.1 glycosyltransferase family 2 protein [Bacillus suaedaesalsae]